MAKSSFFSGTGTTPTNVESVASSKAAAEASENAAAASAAAAAQSATQAGTSNAAADTAKVAAQAAQAAAETAETNAATSAASAATNLAAIGNSETNAANSATSAASSATSATASASAAAASEAATSASETAAAASETAAAASETAAAASEAAASSSQTAAAASETAAATSETNAAYSETQAAASAANASTQASNASTSATAASLSATNASNSETNASNSATAAATSETNAATSETNAATSATSAAASATSATASQTAAATSESNAATSETNAATSASNAATSETNAATSATTATTQASNASTSASNAATSETNAANSATSASTSATTATNAKTAAESARDSALAALDSFDDRYLGVKSSDPSTDNDGNALVAGSLYYNDTDDVMKVYEGSSWVAAYASLSGALLSINNLSDVDSTASARTNLGLAIGTDVQAYSAVLAATTASYTTAEETKLAGVEAGADVTDAANVEPLVDSHLNTSTAASGEYLSWNGTDYDWASVPAGYADSDVDTHLNSGTASSGQYLGWNGTDYAWSTVDLSTKLNLSGGTMTGAINFVAGQTFDGRDVSADGSKLDGIESGATADQTASEILTAIKTVDGSGSGLDADLLDGYNASSGASLNTVVVRDGSGYIFGHYYNGTGTFSTTGNTSGMGLFTGTNGSDTYGRSYTAAAARALLNVADGATNVTNTNQLTNGAGFHVNSYSNDMTCDAGYADNWWRSTGQTGWYSETYAGGIYMQDTTWVRVYNGRAFYVPNQIAATGNVTAYYSDERLKTKTGDIEGALEKIKQLNGFYYVENDLAKEKGYNNDKQQVALSAQEVEAVMPEAVSLAPFDIKTLEDGTIVSESGEDYLTVDYARLVPLLVEAIKEQQQQIDELKAKLGDK